MADTPVVTRVTFGKPPFAGFRRLNAANASESIAGRTTTQSARDPWNLPRVGIGPSRNPRGVWHDRRDSPSRCTVHAPHSPMPQPHLVPVSPRVSRSTHSSGVSGVASIRYDFSFTVIAMLLINHTRSRHSSLRYRDLWERRKHIGTNRRLHAINRSGSTGDCPAIFQPALQRRRAPSPREI